VTTGSLKQNRTQLKTDWGITSSGNHISDSFTSETFTSVLAFGSVLSFETSWFIWGRRNRNHVTLGSWSNRDTLECLYYFPCLSKSSFMIARETWHIDLPKIRPTWKTPQHYTAVYSYLILFIGSVVKVTEWDRVQV